MAPVAQITSGRAERIPLLDDEVTLTAGRTGELFLYVNDAIRPFDWERHYRNNGGTASVVVTRVWARD